MANNKVIAVCPNERLWKVAERVRQVEMQDVQNKTDEHKGRKKSMMEDDVVMKNVKARPGKPKKGRNCGKAAWALHLLFMRYFLVWMEKQYEKLGKCITSRPKTTILVAFLCVSICTIGFVRYKFERKTSKLFVPQNSPSFKTLEDAKPYFYNSLNMRQEEVILLPKTSGGNVLSRGILEDANLVMQNVQNIANYKKLCKPVLDFVRKVNVADCAQNNILEILGNVTHPLETVYGKILTAKSDPSQIMSNGRSFELNVNEILASLKTNATRKSASAKALRIIIFMQQGENETHEDELMNWEKSFIAKMNDLRGQLTHSNIYYTAERSMDDAISDSSSADVSLISITFTVMITFACLMLAKFVNPVRGHNWLAMAGVFSTALGILAGIGATLAFGVPFISLVGIVPFLVVSVGIDDMFILVDEFDRQKDAAAPKDKVKFTLSKVGSTILMTTLTDAVAFFVSTATSFPAIRYFCIYTAVCISIEFLLQITLFIAFMTLDSLRIYQSRSDCCPMKRVRDRNRCDITTRQSLADRVMGHFGRILLKLPVKICVLLVSLCLVAGGIYGCLHINNQFNRKFLALPDSSFLAYVKNFEANFPQTLPVNIQVTKKIDYSNPSVRQEVSKSVKVAYETGYYLSRNISWIASFDEYVARFNISANGADFRTALSSFLSVPQYRLYRSDIIRDNFNEIIASRIVVFYKNNANSEFQKNAMISLRNDLKSHVDADVSAASDGFIYFEQYAVVVEEVIRNLILVSVVVAVIMVPFCIHPLIVLLLVICFAALVVQLFGLMYLWDVQLNSISMITLVMAIGFSVDYSSHIAHAFVISKEDSPDKRIIHALQSVGTSVLLGGVSTFLGMSLTGFAKSQIFQVFFKMFIGIILFGLYNGLVLLPVLLSIFSKWLNTDIQWKYISILQKKANKDASSRGRHAIGNGKHHISILGISTRFPQARTKNQFWELLKKGINTVGDYPTNRLRRFHFVQLFHPARSIPGRHYVIQGSYLENLDGFDYKFFGISKAEATNIDPQQRLILQGTYEAIEDAGVTVEELQQCRTGVYTGLMNTDFSSVVFSIDAIKGIDQFTGTGSALSITANRVSFAFNLTGPSMAIDTACSSSLTALTVACDHIEKGLIDVAIVAAANIILDPLKQVSICKANMLSTDGKCKAFDESADGYGRGEGIAVLILKATEYVVDRDETYGEILSWNANNDGQTAAPITAPSVLGQKTLMNDVLQASGINPDDVQFVELHGTGTFIGDLVETRSVGEIYGAARDPSDPIPIGSVKSNISHTESTAGLAGIAKVCLMMEHNLLVPTVGIQNEAARLALEDKHLLVNTEVCPWPQGANRNLKIAAVNSFGFGGSNGHVIIQKEEKVEQGEQGEYHASKRSDVRMLVLSTKSQQTLNQMADDFSVWLHSLEDSIKNQVDLCYTMSERRTKHSHRLVVNASNLRETSSILKKFVQNPDLRSVDICGGKASKVSSRIGLVFGGQGSQWVGMAGDLLSHGDILSTVHHVDRVIEDAGIRTSILAYLGDELEWNRETNESLVTIQLSIFALQYAVAQFLIRNAGIRPLAVTGHSLGDITAACIANIITLQQAVKIISIRAKVQDRCQQNGAMAAVGLSMEDIMIVIEELNLTNSLSIAAENDQKNVTISGDEAAIDEIEKHLKNKKEQVFIRKLDTKKAFHSHHMDAIRAKFMKKLSKAKITTKSGNMKFFSTTEGQEVIGSTISDCFWWRNLRNPVLFNESVTKMMKHGIRTYIEISPRPVVSHYLREIGKQIGIKEVAVLQALPKKNERERLKHLYFQCVGKMFTLGCDINFDSLQDSRNAKFMRYPPYPWDDQSLWPKEEYNVPESTMLLLGAPVSMDKDHCIWENEIDLRRFPYIEDHGQRSLGTLFPGAGFIELAFEAGIMTNKIHTLTLRNVAFRNVLPLNENVLRKIRCTKQASDDGNSDLFEIALVTDQGDVILSTSEIMTCKKQHSENDLKFHEAYQRDVNDSGQVPAAATVATETPTGADMRVAATDDVSLQLSASVCATSESIDGLILQMAGLRQCDKQDLIALDKYREDCDFIYGKQFSLIEASWASDKVAVIRLKMSQEIMQESADYVMHPCIIDAFTQSVLALELQKRSGSSSPDPPSPALPIGADEIILHPIKNPFQHIYCIAMSDPTQKDSYHLQMTDELGDVIMKINWFRVTDLTVQRRDPSFNKSAYKLPWHASSESFETEYPRIDASFVLICDEKVNLIPLVVPALQKLGVSFEDIKTVIIEEGNIELPIQDKLLPHVTSAYSAGKKMFILNFLPASSHDIPLEAACASKAEWLCFESTLEILKVLSKLKESKLNKSNCGVIAISYNNDPDCLSPAQQDISPWGAVSRGMAPCASLDVSSQVISAGISKSANERDFIKLFLTINKEQVEDRLIIKDGCVFEPVMSRFNMEAIEDEESGDLFQQQDDVYLSWSISKKSIELKRLSPDSSILPPGFVEIKVSHVSSVFGQTDRILDKVRQCKSQASLQCAVGCICAINDGSSEFKIGDEVIALISSKWVRTRIRLQAAYVFRKPTFLSRPQVSALSASFAYASRIISRLAGSDVSRMYVAASECDRGFCWMIAKVAGSQGIDVKVNDILESKICTVQEICDEVGVIDCLVCSSDLHPADVKLLTMNLRKDSIVVLVDINGESRSVNLNFQEASTVVNISPSNGSQAADLIPFMDKDLNVLQAIIQARSPDIRFENLNMICKSRGPIVFANKKAFFNCLQLEADNDWPLRVMPPSIDYQGLKEDRTYIVVGGARGIGLKTVEWMVSRGARIIVVIGVSQLPFDTQARFNELERTLNARILHLRANIAKEDVIKILDDYLRELPEVAGVVNSAGILDDKNVTSIEKESYQRVMGPKISGTLNLHKLIERRNTQLDFFLMYSSVVSMIGNNGQASYSAANEFLNGFAKYQRRVCGKQCFAICWGAMGGAGMLERNKKVAQVLEKAGIFQLDIDQGIKWMEEILLTCRNETSICLSDLDWDSFMRGLSQLRQKSTLFSSIAKELTTSVAPDEERILDQLMKAGSKDDQEEILVTLVRRMLMGFTGGTEEEIDIHVALFSYGVDSVGASFMKSRIFSELDIDLETFYFMLPETTPISLAKTLLEKLNEKMTASNTQTMETSSHKEANGFKGRRRSSRGRYHSFRTVAPKETAEDDSLKLPDNYLTPIYNPPDAIAKIFIVHPSHRYAGVFQPVGTGMKYQELFSLYAFGSQEPGYHGEDIETVGRLANACIKLMLKEQPHGPYFVAGYSFGGKVALEMATILQNMGEDVALLAMIDTLMWLPEEEYNSRALIESQPMDFLTGGIQKQIREFLAKIATTQLNMSLNEYNEFSRDKNNDELAEILSERAATLETEIPDTRKLVQAVMFDHEMVKKCVDKWYPPVDCYDGPLLYIAADTCLCQSRTNPGKCGCKIAIGSAGERWSTLLGCDTIFTKCVGDHYTMMEKSRGLSVGHVLAVVSSLVLRRALPMAGGIKLNTNHKLSMEICKNRGITVCMVRKSVFGTVVTVGFLKINETGSRIIFQGKGLLSRNVEIKVKDVVNIKTMDTISLRRVFGSTDFTHLNLHSGLCFQELKRKITLMCFNKQDFKYLTYLVEGLSNISLPF